MPLPIHKVVCLNILSLLSSMKTQEKPCVISPQPRGLKSVIQIMGSCGRRGRGGGGIVTYMCFFCVCLYCC